MPRLGAFLSPLGHFGCTGHWPPSSRRTPFLPHWPLGCRPARLAADRELGSLSCPIPPSFVLSHNMPVINTTSNGFVGALFRHRQFPPTAAQATGHSPLGPRPTPSARWVRRRCRAPSRFQHSPPGRRSICDEMLRCRVVWRSSARLIFVASCCKISYCICFSLDSRGPRL